MSETLLKRVKKLEKIEKQRLCTHSDLSIVMSRGCMRSVKCDRCELEFSYLSEWDIKIPKKSSLKDAIVIAYDKLLERPDEY